ncbi:MAG: hypothetical protein AAB445_01335 [Patescibacteria group bacterium]
MTEVFYPALVTIVSFFFWKYVSGKSAGEQGRMRSLRFTFGRYTFWLHHWLYCSIAIVALLSVGVYHPLVYGFLLGGVIQGLTYKDFYYVVFQTEKYPYRKL